ncbi:MAG TPA: AfsR/SARP family transcriptional regulator [Streptosporangiaceae bacterium]|nr:AfsR/SARP family transcriptional regulator [Streptosporangiaceae bacterium]
MTIRINVLGPLQVSIDSRDCTPSARMVRRVVALLAMRANRAVQMESLIEELWGTEPPPSAVTTVQTYIYHLRKIFAASGVENVEGTLLVTRPAGYVLQLGEECLDAQVFEQRTAAGAAMLEQHDNHAADTFRQALGMWAGPALADVPMGSLLQAHVVHLEEVRLSALEMRIQADMRLGRHRQLIGELRSLVASYPLNEWFHAHLIEGLSRAGRRSEALQAYQHVRTVLCNELGVDPSPELQRLQLEVLEGGASDTPRNAARLHRRVSVAGGALPHTGR